MKLFNIASQRLKFRIECLKLNLFTYLLFAQRLLCVLCGSKKRNSVKFDKTKYILQKLKNRCNYAISVEI